MSLVLPVLWACSIDDGLTDPYWWITTALYLHGPANTSVICTFLMIFMTIFYYEIFRSKALPLANHSKDTSKSSRDLNGDSRTTHISNIDSGDSERRASGLNISAIPTIANQISTEASIYLDTFETNMKISKHEILQEADVWVYCRSLLRVLVIVGVNIAINGAITVLYSRALNHSNEKDLPFITMGIALFKMFWGKVGMRYLLITNTYLHFGASEREADVMILRMFGSLTTFQSFLDVLNDVVIPILGFALSSPSCFYYAFFQRSAEPYEVTIPDVCEFFEDQNGTPTCKQYCDVPIVEGAEDLYEPFTYLYECSSIIIRAYTNVFIFQFTIDIAFVAMSTFLVLYFDIHENQTNADDEEGDDANDNSGANEKQDDSPDDLTINYGPSRLSSLANLSSKSERKSKKSGKGTTGGALDTKATANIPCMSQGFNAVVPYFVDAKNFIIANNLLLFYTPKLDLDTLFQGNVLGLLRVRKDKLMHIESHFVESVSKFSIILGNTCCSTLLVC
jgi:hypothetical protein